MPALAVAVSAPSACRIASAEVLPVALEADAEADRPAASAREVFEALVPTPWITGMAVCRDAAIAAAASAVGAASAFAAVPDAAAASAFAKAEAADPLALPAVLIAAMLADDASPAAGTDSTRLAEARLLCAGLSPLDAPAGGVCALFDGSGADAGARALPDV